MTRRRAQLRRRPLAGIRVLDLSTMLAGPVRARRCSATSAPTSIKVESHYGDDSRHLGPERDGERAPFLALNRNKRAIVLDLAAAGRAGGLRAPAATATSLITNVREPALSRLGLDYEQVRAHRPDIIWVGRDGVRAGRALRGPARHRLPGAGLRRAARR